MGLGSWGGEEKGKRGRRTRRSKNGNKRRTESIQKDLEREEEEEENDKGGGNSDETWTKGQGTPNTTETINSALATLKGGIQI